MIQLHKRHLVLLAVIIGSSFLSACSGTQSPSSVSSSALENKNITSPVTATEDSSDFITSSGDSDTCLQQELEALRRTGPWDNDGQPLTGAGSVQSDFPVVMNRQVQMYIDFFQNEQRKVFTAWLSRSKQYLPMMQKELKEAGLPLDLAYLPMIESGFNQRACSSAQATGLWQFMTDTGRQYNLRIDSYVDERRDAEKSTKAAVALLGNLYHEFGDWNLAVAAYNAGSGKIGTGLKKYNVNTFWDLARQQYLSLETVRYVPQLMAAIIIAKDPEKFGFTDIKFTSLPAYETLEVGPGLGLDGLALVTNSSKEELQILNQELIAGKTPVNDHKFRVKIPAGTRTLALNNLPRLRSIVNTEYKTHTIGHHESLASVSKKYGVPQTALLKANHFKNKRLQPGQRLRIPVYAVHYQLAREGADSIARSDNNRILHEARAEHVSIDNTHRADHSIMLAAHKKDLPLQTAKNEFKVYRIVSGDTLWSISQKFRTSPDQIKGWNNLTSNDIHPGNTLKVKEPNAILAERRENTVL